MGVHWVGEGMRGFGDGVGGGFFWLILFYSVFFIFFMQKKVGIRLRHLQGPSEQPRHQPQVTYRVQQPIPQQNRKRERSPSPLSRRKIFQPPNQQKYQQLPQQPPINQKIAKKPVIEPSRPPAVMMSPIMNQPLNSNNVSINDGNYEYESEVERLIDSLKKKSLELERKQEIISRLNREVDYLITQNKSYCQQIATLKAQLQYERSSTSPNPQRNSHMPQPQPQTKSIPQVRTSKMPYNNQAYEQQKSPIIHVKINPNNPLYRDEQPKARYNKLGDDRHREQDSVLSDYLSPLMVLNQTQPKSIGTGYSGTADRNLMSKNSKTNSRIQYNINQRQEIKQQSYPSTRNQPNYTQPAIENPFARKNELFSTQRQLQPQQTQQPDRFLYESAGNFGPHHPPNTRQFDREYERQRENRGWPTLESNAPRFNTINDGPPETQQNRYSSSRKELAIEDSKQFRFEDFDFSELDHSVSNSQF